MSEEPEHIIDTRLIPLLKPEKTTLRQTAAGSNTCRRVDLHGRPSCGFHINEQGAASRQGFSFRAVDQPSRHHLVRIGVWINLGSMAAA
ncbi:MULTISPECIES: hypothetical protein [Xanthobacteraceae]|uniref:Uncharacterized protein n=1 Tax=Labrys monachus TaxID=217067 RepID=A0ABU0FG02_9HYPH|nr:MULTISPECIES: hypothetical protein [Xanthobacteraceae]MBS7540648.1 hypothetical protein [Ancylobacter lacus]MDQ0393536.1 hypothetical protein [Labrys monachus]